MAWNRSGNHHIALPGCFGLSLTITFMLGLAGVIIWLVVTQNLAQLSVLVGLIASMVAIVSTNLIFYFTVFKKPEKQEPLLPSHKREAETPQIPPSKTLWNVPYRRNLYFTGREDVLEALQKRLIVTKAAALTQSQAISGLGGIGKTQVAVEYAYRYREEYHAVLWVNAETRDTIIASFLELATLLTLPQQQEADQNKVIAAVKRWFTEHDQWLLIFDNADDLALAEEFLPTGDNGSLLLATRNQAPGTLAESLIIRTMEKDEGMLLVLRRAKRLARDAPLEQALPADRAGSTHCRGNGWSPTCS